MSSASVKKKLLKTRAGLLAELGALSQLLHGSWVERYSVCSRAACKCRRGERHGPRHYLVVNEAGRQRQKYVPNSQTDAALGGLAQCRRLQEIAACRSLAERWTATHRTRLRTTKSSLASAQSWPAMVWVQARSSTWPIQPWSRRRTSTPSARTASFRGYRQPMPNAHG